MYFFKKPIKG